METPFLNQPRGYRELLMFYFLQEGTNQFLLMVITTLFLKKFGADGLPWYYIGNNILFITSQMLIMRWPGWRGHGFLTRFSKIVVALCVVLAFASPLGTVPLFLVALFFGVFYLHSFQAGAELIGQILSLQEAKIFLARVFAAGTAGCIIGGLSLKFLVDTCGFRVIFLLAATNFLINDVLLGRLKQYLPSNAETPSHSEGAGAKVGTPTPFAWSRSPNIRSFAVLLWLIAFFAYFSRVLVDFLYATNLSLFIPSESDLAGFFGIFGATLDVVVFLAQTFFVGKIFQIVSLGSLYAARALLVTMVALLAFMAPSVFSISATQFIFLGMTWTFINPASLMLLEIIPDSPRLVLRRFIAMGESAANILVGLFLLLPIVGSGQSNSWLFLVIVGTSILLLFLTSRLNSACSATVGESLRLTDTGSGPDLTSLQFIPPEEACLKLSRVLAEADTERRYQLILQAGSIPGGEAALLAHLPEERASRNLTAIFRVLIPPRRVCTPTKAPGCGGKCQEGTRFSGESDRDPPLAGKIHECLQNMGDAEHLSVFIEALGIAEVEAAAAWITGYLEHPRLAVRQSAISCILRAGFEPSHLRAALGSLKKLMTSASSDERAAGARVMGILGLPMFIPHLGHLADDVDMGVTELAMRGLAGIPSLAALREIGRRRDAPGERGELAQVSWIDAGQGRRKVFQVLGGLTAAERDNAIHRMQSLCGNLDFALLSRVLQLPQPRIREGLLKFLGECGPEGLEIVSGSLRQTADGGQVVSGNLLLSRLQNRSWKTLLPEAELLGLVGGLEDPGIADFLKHLLLDAWKEHLLPLHPACIAPGSGPLASPEESSKEKQKGKPIGAVLRRILAFSTNDPAGCLDALEKAASTDRYTQTVAQEFLEGKLGKSFLRLLSPFLNDELRFPTTIPPECHDLFKEAGLPIQNHVSERTNVHA
ncbi:MAG: MFS transporter [Candidatus Ozemobacteraceae bacterium]